MRGRAPISAAFAIAAFMAATAALTANPALGQGAPDPAARKALTEAASALGMVRGLNRALDIVNMFEFTANGTMSDPRGGAPYKVDRITASIDYVIPAARVDVQRAASDASAQRTIEVAAGPLAWDETTPGTFLRSAGSSAAERLKEIWLLPQALILAGAKAPDKVKLSETGDRRELSVALPDGSEIKGVLDAKNFPAHIEYSTGGQVFSGDYSDFKDFQDYGVMFPAHIVQKLDGRTIADLTVTEALANPYMIFPPPKELAQRPRN